jgi:3-mercaptopyruvate sulfurtransferase SseA
VGIDNVLGYLEGGFEAWRDAGEEIDLIIDIEPDELAMDIPHDSKLEELMCAKQVNLMQAM